MTSPAGGARSQWLDYLRAFETPLEHPLRQVLDDEQPPSTPGTAAGADQEA